MKPIPKHTTTLILPLLVGVVLLITLALTISTSSKNQQIRSQAAGGNSLLCGTNLGLFDSSDSFLTSTGVQNAVKTLHVQIIRMPIRNFTPNTIELQAAQVIKKLGATPLVVLSLSAPDPVAAGRQTIQAMNGIFGSSLVYYELGNEQFNSNYIAKWNQIIPQLASVPQNGRFIGPVAAENFGSETATMANFWHQATPKPYALSWHEYPCGTQPNQPPQSAQYCLDHVDTTPGHNWGQHITDTVNAIRANGDTVPPIFITEWNYDSTPPNGDSRNTPQFQQQFTQRALTQLAKEGVAAATQYVLNTNTSYNLVDNNGNLTAAGSTFQQQCAQFAGNNPTTTPPQNLSSTPILSSPTPTMPFASPTLFCLGSCPTLAPTAPFTSQSPSTGPSSPLPSSTSTGPTLATSASPNPTGSENGENDNDNINKKSKKQHKRRTTGNLQKLIQQLLQLIQKLLQLLKTSTLTE